MRFNTTLFFLFFSLTFLSAQRVITPEDINPTIGDNWFIAFASGGVEAFDVDLGAQGENAVFDFSQYATDWDYLADTAFVDLNEENAYASVEIIDGSTLENVPALFQGADFFFDYQQENGANWFMPFRIGTEALEVMGEMAMETGSNPPSWHHFAVHYGPGRNMAYNLTLGDSITLSRYVIDDQNGLDSIAMTDQYFFDAEGEFIGMDGVSVSEVCRIIHQSNIEIYSKIGGEWVYQDYLEQRFIQFRKRGYQLPLVEVSIDYTWTPDQQIINSWEVLVDFFVPTFSLPTPPVSVGEIKSNSPNIQVSPNPASDFVTINWLGNSNQNLEIAWYDLQGRLLKNDNWNNAAENDFHQINTPLTAGMYLLKITSEEGVYSEKIMIE